MGAEDTAYRSRSMAEGPGRAGRPDDTYSVAGRIESRPSRRGRLTVVLLALVVVGWAGVTVGDRLAGRQPGRSAAPSLVADASAEPTPVANSGYLPSLEVGGRGAVGRLPLMLGGLAWLDLSLPRIDSALDLDQDQWDFALPFGETACICLVAEPTGGAELVVRRFGPSGDVGYADPIANWLTPDDLRLIDAAPTPDGRAAIVASVVTSNGTDRLRIERFALFADDPAGRTLESAPLDLEVLGDPARLTMRVMVAPDGSLVRVRLQQLGEDLVGITGVERSWVVPIEPAGGFGAFAEEPPVPDDVAPLACPGAALATPTTVVALCTTLGTDASGQSGLILRIDRRGRYQDVDLGPVPTTAEAIGWQVDGATGTAYVWEAFSHRLFRVSVATGAVAKAVLGNGLGQNRPTIEPSPTAPAVRPGVPPPTLWQPTDSARNVRSNLLAGSTDGRWLYAGGLTREFGSPESGSVDSTGIWVFDTETLKPVAHWLPIAAYQSLGLSPDGSYLVGIGNPSTYEINQYGDHGPQLVLHDPADGSVLEIQRSLVLRLGGMPYLLPAGPPPPVP